MLVSLQLQEILCVSRTGFKQNFANIYDGRGKIAPISKVPKSLKGCISNTFCSRHTKLGSDLPKRVLNTRKVLLWCCILLIGNHGNQHDLK